MDPVDVGTDSRAAPARERVPAGQRLRSLLWGSASGAGVSTPDPLAEVIREHRMIHPHADVDAVRKAYEIADRAHRGQVRKSGEPFITHPLAVTRILAVLGMDTTALVAALLHDTVEDTSYTLEALYHDFGADVATVVDGVTKVERVSYGDDAEAETIRKMIIAAGRDVRVLVVKLADRLHNMRTLGVRSPSSRARVALATRDVLVPLCDRLGIQALKRELEDSVLLHLEPESYARIEHYMQHRLQWAGYLEQVIGVARVALRRHRVEAEIRPRPRHYYSIWRDTIATGHPEPYDLPRIVIIVDGPDTDCYAALGAMHGSWRPVPGRFKDFIASPKNNLYRSLHTTVIGPEDRSVEILIRTEAMHRSAEYGIVASYRYGRPGETYPNDQLPWLRRVLEWQREATDPAQFLEALHSDLVESQIHVFTPAGRKVLLPVDSTPVDLAYVLDTHVGDSCIAALINGRLAPVSSPLADGDVVDILTRHDDLPEDALDEETADDQRPAGPAREWLTFVKTPHARLQIGRWFTDHDDDQPATGANKIRLGRAAIGLALRRRDRGLASDLPLLRLAGQLGYPDLEALYVAVAERRITAEHVVEELIALVDDHAGSRRGVRRTEPVWSDHGPSMSATPHHHPVA